MILLYRYVSAAPTLAARDVCNQGINNPALWLANYAPMRSFCPIDDSSWPVGSDGKNLITQLSVTTIATRTQFTTVATAYAYATTIIQPFKAKRQVDATDDNSSGSFNIGITLGNMMEDFINPLFDVVPAACSCLQRPFVTQITTLYEPTAAVTAATTITTTVAAQIVVPTCAISPPFIPAQWQNPHFRGQCGALVALWEDGYQFFGDRPPDSDASSVGNRLSGSTNFMDCYMACVSSAQSECIAFSFGLESGTCDLFSGMPGDIRGNGYVSVKELVGWAWGSVIT